MIIANALVSRIDAGAPLGSDMVWIYFVDAESGADLGHYYIWTAEKFPQFMPIFTLSLAGLLGPLSVTIEESNGVGVAISHVNIASLQTGFSSGKRITS